MSENAPSSAEKTGQGLTGTDLSAPKSETVMSNSADATKVNTSAANSIKEKGNAVDVISSSEGVATTSAVLTGRKLALAHLGFLLAIFCVALDQTIVSTALPKLASQFNALDELTWVVSAYFLTQAGLMLFFGQVLTITSSKWVYLTCILLFEIGSLICGVAPSMPVLIFGRAFQGIGASGIFISILTLLSLLTRLDQRPMLFGSFGGVFALASVVGPLIGGVFTDKVTWRWCFYINLPFGAISIAAVFLFLPQSHPPPNPFYDGKTVFEKWLSLDWIGAFISVCMITCLLLPLQWGGTRYEWNNRIIIALFCTFAALFVCFIAWEVYKKDRAMLPLGLFKRRTQTGGGLAMFFITIAFLGTVVYLPFFYQAKGRTASESGIDIIPFMLSSVLATIISGGIVNATGHYLTILLIGPLVASVGAGLLFTINEDTTSGALIGFQIILGVGLGASFQLPIIAVQAEYSEEVDLIPQASSVLSFFQLLGGVVGIAIAGTIFNNQLSTQLTTYAGNLPPELVQGVKQSVIVIFSLPIELQRPVIHAYVKALDYTFILAIPACICATLVSLFIKNWNLKTRSAGTTVAAV